MRKRKSLQVEHLKSFNWEGALRGMRNAWESWEKSDSTFGYYYKPDGENITGGYPFKEKPNLGPNDVGLALKLGKEGRPNRKFLRQIFVSCDIIASGYFWRQYATYKVGTVENSTSQMHKLGGRPLTRADFMIDQWGPIEVQMLDRLNAYIECWKEYEAPKKGGPHWRAMIQAIPYSYIYRRTCTLNYEVLANMYHWRNNHTLTEWQEFFQQLWMGLPYPGLYMGEKA